jgi:hypothetical protein
MWLGRNNHNGMPSLDRVFRNTRESGYEISIIRIKLNFVAPARSLYREHLEGLLASVLLRYVAVFNIRKNKATQTSTDEALTIEYGAHRFNQFPCDVGLCHEAGSPRTDCLFHNVRRRRLADEEDFGHGGQRPDLSRGFNPIESRKADIHQDKVWLQLVCSPHSL